MILDYLWQYPAYVNLLNIVDLVSVSYPPVSLCPKRVGSFGSSTDFLVKRKLVGSDMFR
jgi:hypothetical protein